ncbi:MAG: hypothetical protein ACE145_00775 [Terriglobia bacterium]
MRKISSMAAMILAVVALAMWPSATHAQGGFELVSGKAFDSAVPKDFYLEGNAIPTQKRNAALVKTPAGARVLFALIDTTGYSSQIQQKYEGMIISEAKVAVCGVALGVGSYGFGFTKPAATSAEAAKFFVYNQAGGKVGECTMTKDAELKQPVPLHVVAAKGGPAKLYLGKNWLEVK